MTKVTTITCDECHADITNASHTVVSNVDIYIPSLCMNMHFCGYKHFYAYLDKRRPEELKDNTQ